MFSNFIKYFIVSAVVTVLVVGYVFDENTAMFTLVISLIFFISGYVAKGFTQDFNMKSVTLALAIGLPPLLYFITPYIFKFIAKTFHLKVIFA